MHWIDGERARRRVRVEAREQGIDLLTGWIGDAGHETACSLLLPMHHVLHLEGSIDVCVTSPLQKLHRKYAERVAQ